MGAFVAEKLVTELVACSDHHVVRPVGAIFNDRQHWPSKTRKEDVALPRFDIERAHPAVGRRQPLGRILGIISEEVRSLSALGRGYSHQLILLHQHRAPFSGRYCQAQWRRSPVQGPSRGSPTSICSGALTSLPDSFISPGSRLACV